MQVSLESLDGLERKLTVQLQAEQVDQAVEKKLREIAKEARLDGFRPGKIPLKVIRRRFGDSARNEVYGDLINQSFYQAAVSENVNPIGEPEFNINDTSDGSFSYSAKFEVAPEIKLADLSDTELEQKTSEVTDADVKMMLETLRKQQVKWEVVQRAAQLDDRVTINFVGKIDNEAFEGGATNDASIVLGSGQMIEGFEQGLVGVFSGEKRSLDATFPDDYIAQHLAGKPATFDIDVIKVEAPQLPEINEDFAKEFGIKDGAVEKLHEEVRENMLREMRQKLSGINKEIVMNILLEKHEFDAPEAMINAEAMSLLEEAKRQMQQQKDLNMSVDVFKEQAERRVRLGLLVSEIVKVNALTLQDQHVRKKIEDYAQAFEKPQEIIDWYYADQSRLEPVKNAVLEDNVIQWVVDQAKVNEDKIAFSELS